jgi:hypothetical protein
MSKHPIVHIEFSSRDLTESEKFYCYLKCIQMYVSIRPQRFNL